MQAAENVQVLEFLKTHVIGRALAAPPIITHTDHNGVASAYEEDAIYSNLCERANGFSYDLTTLARGTRYLPQKAGFAAEGTLNSVRTLRYELTERASSHRLVGHSRFIASTNSQPDPFAGVVFLVQMAIEQGALVVYETMTGYADFAGPDGHFHPGAVDGKYVYSLDKGRLAIHYEQARFDVDPVTLARKPTSDRFPAQVSHEVVFPNPNVAAV